MTTRSGAASEKLPHNDAWHADIGLVCALSLEINEFLSRCERVRKYTGGKFTFRGGLYDGIRVAVVESGPGLERAGRATQALLEAHEPKWCLSVGCSGALIDAMKVGHIAVGTAILRPPHAGSEGERIELTGAMPADPARGLHVGPLITVDDIIRRVDDKRALAQQTGAIAADMESYAVADFARRKKTPFMAIRAISDDLSADLPPEVLAVLGGSGTIRTGAIAGALWKRPSSIKDLWNLRGHASQAADALADFLDGIVKQLAESTR